MCMEMSEREAEGKEVGDGKSHEEGPVQLAETVASESQGTGAQRLSATYYLTM